jgi:branched-chain amino acid transport system ATP-binding protein
VIRAEIWHVVEKLKAEGQSILLIDKTFSVLKRLADRHFILEKGRTVWMGDTEDLLRDRAQVQAYIGV